MDRKTFLKSMCGLGVCGCAARVLDPPALLASGQPEAQDQRLVFARNQIAHVVRFMAASAAVPACTEVLEKTGGECARLGGAGTKFKGDPEGYFAAARKAWSTEFHWDKAAGRITVAVAEGPCGCPLVDAGRTPSFWCNCSVGYQKEVFAGVFGRPVQASIKQSKLAGDARCVFEVLVGPSA